MDEKELLIRLKSGEQHAFVLLYDKYSRRIYQNTLRVIKIPEIAEELLQDTFVRIWEKKQYIDPEKSFQAYLFRIAQNLAYDHFRQIAKDQKLSEQLLTLVEEYNPLDELIETKQSITLLNSALKNLPVKRREVFTLCKLEGRSYQEVSSLLGISESTINDHIVKATKSLKQYFVQSREISLTILLSLLLIK